MIKSTPAPPSGFWCRLSRGLSWSWRAERVREILPSDIVGFAMTVESNDRRHAKQGRSTCRVRVDGPAGTLSVYLKRHTRLGAIAGLGALLRPHALHSPAAIEWARLRDAEAAGVPVPEAVAVGEQVGPWGHFRSFLMVTELADCAELNEVLPRLASGLDAQAFASRKRALTVQLARVVARLHGANLYHKDLYLCHVFVNPADTSPEPKLTLIDLHRLGKHTLGGLRWRVKDLGQLLFSTFGVEGIAERDRLRFWSHYRRAVRPRRPALLRQLACWKAARYAHHNRQRGGGSA